MITTACPRCGKVLNFEDQHAGLQGQCDQCNTVFNVPHDQSGYQPNYNAQQNPYPGYEPNGLAIAGFVVSLVSLFICGVVAGPLSIIFSAIAMQRPGKRGFAIAGLVIGIISTIGAIIYLAFMAGHRRF